MGYYSSRKPYYDLTKSQVEFFAGSSRFLKQSLVKESVMEKPYLEDEYQKMHLAIPPPIKPRPYPPPGPFGPIWGVISVTFPPATCMMAHKTTTAWHFHWWNSCGDVTTIEFCVWSYFEEEWSWTYTVSSSELNVEDLTIEILPEGISLSANISGTAGVVLVCGTGTAGMIPLTWQATYLLGGPVPHLQDTPAVFTEIATQPGLVHCCTEVEFDCDSCIPDPAMAWDYETSGETVAQDDSCVVAVTGLNQPFTWSVSGTGFTLAEAETTGLTNTLLADASSCGTATITVTGCDGVTVTGYVRGAVGQWVAKNIPIGTCPLSGSATSYDGASACIIKGYQKLFEVKTRVAWCVEGTGCTILSCDPDLCPGDYSIPANYHCITDYNCAIVDPVCLEGASVRSGCCCKRIGIDQHAAMRTSKGYYEWEC